MSQIPGSYAPDDVPEGSIDNSQRGRERQQNNDDYVAMKGSTSIGIPNPTGAKLVDTNPSPPNPWENKSPFDVNTGTEPWDSVENEKPEEVGPVVEDDSLPRNVAVQPQGEHHQQIREGREAVKEPVDEVIGEPRATTSPEKTHSPSQNQKSQELAALAALTGGQPIHGGDSRQPYSEEERAGHSLVHGDRLAREVQHEQHPEHDRMRATGQEHEREREKEREQTHQHEKERQLARRREMEREHEVQREKEREQERRREEERERQRAQQFKQQQKGTHGEHDRARRGPSESESSNEEMYHDTQEEHPTDQNQSRLGRKKSKASATMTKAMGTLKEKVGKLVHHEKTADKGTEQKMVGDTRKKLADVNYS